MWKNFLQRGDIHVLPDVVSNIRNRIEELIKLENWKRTGNDAIRAFWIFLQSQEDIELSEHFKQQIVRHISSIIYLLHQLSQDDREKIYVAAGDKGEFLREMLESNQ